MKNLSKFPKRPLLYAKLTHHTFPDDSTWGIMHDCIPLGSLFKVYQFYSGGEFTNLKDGRTRIVDIVLCVDDDGHAGYIPIDVLELSTPEEEIIATKVNLQCS